MALINILAAVPPHQAERYTDELGTYDDFRLHLVSTAQAAVDMVRSRTQPVDVVVFDNGLEGMFEALETLRESFPRLLIILVDEEADFATPGKADDISTDPFVADDLARRITRLIADRRLETIRVDALAPVRDFAKKLRNARTSADMVRAAVHVCLDLGYDYAAYYNLSSVEPLRLVLQAQDGLAAIHPAAPPTASADDWLGHVFIAGRSRLADIQSAFAHPLVVDEKLSTVVAAPVMAASTPLGVLVAGREAPSPLTEPIKLMLDLIAAQLAAVLANQQLD